MKRFMQMLLASFGVLALMLAGCNSTDTATSDDATVDTDTSVTDDSATTTTDAAVDTTTSTDAVAE